MGAKTNKIGKRVWEVHVTDTPVDTTGPARKTFHSRCPVMSQNTPGRISSVLSRSGGRDRLVLLSLLRMVIIDVIQDSTDKLSAFSAVGHIGH
jgi:hypothetical protein